MLIDGTTELLLKAMLVGIGGTVVLDLYAWSMARFLGVPATNWAMVGRWFGNMARGHFVHPAMIRAEPVTGELAIGWTAHYVIGAGYGVLLLALKGQHWLVAPTLLPPLILAWVLLIAPYFIMMPGMGMGIAGALTPKPAITRLRSTMGHTVFGAGMFATAVLLATYLPSADQA